MEEAVYSQYHEESITLPFTCNFVNIFKNRYLSVIYLLADKRLKPMTYPHISKKVKKESTHL